VSTITSVGRASLWDAAKRGGVVVGVGGLGVFERARAGGGVLTEVFFAGSGRGVTRAVAGDEFEG
jgi:hypothetical protein